MRVHDQARLAEIDENLIRNELSELEKSEHLEERKRILEEMGKARKHGGKEPDIGSFVDQTAEATGLSKSTIKQSVKRAKSISPEVRDDIRDMPEIADKGVELEALAKTNQRATLDAAKAGAKHLPVCKKPSHA